MLPLSIYVHGGATCCSLLYGAAVWCIVVVSAGEVSLSGRQSGVGEGQDDWNAHGRKTV